MSTTPRLDIVHVVEGQANADRKVNEALNRLATFANAIALETMTTQAAPPGSPSNGQAWLVSSSPTGGSLFDGHADELALYMDGWLFTTPAEGMEAYAKDNDGRSYYTGSAWVRLLSSRGAAVADATGSGDVVAQLNALLARMRAHGLIAP